MLVQQRSLVRILWSVSALILLGVGVGLIWWPDSRELTQLRARAQEMYEEANQNEEEERHAADVLAARSRVLDDVRTLSGQGSGATATARALQLLADESKKYHVAVRSVIPAAASASPPTAGALQGDPVTVAVHGKFRDIIAMLSDLPRHDALIETDGIAMSARTERSTSPILDATVNATLYRLNIPVPAEDARDSSHL